MTGDGDGDMEGAQATDTARDTAVTEEDIGPIEDRGKELSRKRSRRSASSSASRGSAPVASDHIFCAASCPACS